MASFQFGTDFGQKVDLTASIRGILRNYPEGTSILKELVQNADDAGAKVFSICLDERHHPTSTCADKSLAQFQGPALLAYNSGIFTERDFQSIQRIGDSLKKTADDQNKIGRFGIGFNAVYHLTDLPSFVSNGRLVMLDPQARFLPNVNPSNPGKMVDYIKAPAALTAAADQFSPYHARGKPIDWKKPFQGTVFRLPLRTPAQGETSTLSKRALSIAEAHDLLESLRAEASAMLLFLKHVETIEISYWDSNDNAPVVRFCCTITNADRELRAQRTFVGDVRRHEEVVARNKALPADFSLDIECLETLDKSGKKDRGGESVTFVERWEVCNQLGGPKANTIAGDPANALLRLVPWGGVAACVSSTYTATTDCESIQSGLAYCFLPLPVRTGLPIMVNGFFELSSNRRDVWQAGSDMTGDGQTRARWNIALMADIVAPCYSRLLLRLRGIMGFTDAYQKMWPDASVPAPWSNVVDSTLRLAAGERLLEVCTSADTLTALLGSPTQSIDVPATRYPHEAWVACSVAIVLPDTQTHGLEMEEGYSQLCSFLVRTREPVVLCRHDLRKTLTEKEVCSQVAEPRLVRQLLRKESVRQLVSSNEEVKRLCGFLLRYCLSDYAAGSPDGALNDLPLLPLCDDSVAALKVFTPAQARSVQELLSMGFSATRGVAALAQTGFDVGRASELLMTSSSSPSSEGAATGRGVVILSDDLEELRVFAGAASLLLDTSKVGPKEKAFLVHKRMQEVSNVRVFQPAYIPDLLLHILPPCFSTLEGHSVPRKALKQAQLETIQAFLSDFWTYAATRPAAIEAVSGGTIAVVPSRGYESFLPLSPLSHLLAPSTGTNQLPADVVDIVALLGVNVVEVAAFKELGSMASVFWKCVNVPNRSGILSSLERLSRLSDKSNEALFAAVTPDQRDTLRLFIAQGGASRLEQDEVEALRSLPLLRRVNEAEEGGKHALHVAANYSSFSSGRGLCVVRDGGKIPSELFPPNFVRYEDDQDLALLRALGVDVWSRTQFYREQVLKNAMKLYQAAPAVMEGAMLAMLTDISALLEEDEAFHDALRKYAFLTGGAAGAVEEIAWDSFRLFRPAELYDPQEQELKELLDESFFPSSAFQGADTLVVLRSLGMQSSLSWNGVVECAKTIAEASEATSEASLGKLKRATCLLHFLDKNIEDLLRVNEPKKQTGGGLFGGFMRGVKSVFVNEEPVEKVPISLHIASLQQIAWLPAPRISIHPCMPWPDEVDSCTASPLDSRPVADAWLCSADYRIVTETVSHPELRDRVLNWTVELPVTTIARQLHEISVCYEKVKAGSDAGSDSDGTVTGSLQDTRETITGLIPQLYQRLNSRLSPDPDDSTTEEVKAILRGRSWIWVGDTFVAADTVALTAGINATPYLYQLPQDLRVYSRLLSIFQVKAQFEPRDYVAVLYRMAEMSGQLEDQELGVKGDGDKDSVAKRKAENRGRDEAGGILVDREVDLACQLVTQISTEGSITTIASRGIYAPDNNGRLGLSVALMYDDVPWMSGPQYISIRSGCRFIHPNISSHVADKMGVRSLRQALVDKSTEGNEMFLDDDNTSKMEAFGQAESLTSRLKTILDLYPDGNPIFSELIQNADDAGASTVRILIDETSYERESLLDSRMAALQGPSLLVYNDAVFTEADFRSLARIGQGSKLEKVSATGRFGLGFNSTYHLTDTPTFVSGEFLVIFDPHCLYAPGATTNQPGLKIRCHGNNMASTFPDQFSPYRYFGCDFDKPFKGTLFRFPLRNRSMARKSEISSRSYEVSDVEQNLNQLIGGLSHYLLFLRSVKTIEIYRQGQGVSAVDTAGGEPTLLYRASATAGAPDYKNDQRLLRYFDRGTSRTGVAPSRDQFYSELSRTSDDSLPTCSQRVRVEVESYEPFVQTGQAQGSASSGGGGGSGRKEKEMVEYLLISGLRGGGAKKLACDPATRHLKLIPLGGVAACLHRKNLSGDGSAPQEEHFPRIRGQAFCFLPLPIQTKLPVHCNAYWELSSNRRDIWRGEDTQGEAKLRSDWNVLVMTDVLAPLYSMLLLKLSSLFLSNGGAAAGGRGYAQVLSLLPCPVPPEPWNGLSTPLFQLLKEEKLLWSNRKGGQLVSPGAAILIEQAAGSAGAVAVDGAVDLSVDLGGSGKAPAVSGGSSGVNVNNESAAMAESRSRDKMEEVLLLEDLNVARVPLEVLRALVDEKVSNEVTPGLVRRHFTRKDRPHRVLNLGDDGASSSNMERVIFLLQYCFSDVDKSTYSCLHGLPMMPLDSGGLGTLSLLDQTGAPVKLSDADMRDMFVVTEAERHLFKMAGGYIVAPESIIGTEVNKAVHDSTFAELMNVRRVTSKDLQYLLRKFIPGFWFEEERTVVNRADVASDEWLTRLWEYVVAEKHLDLFTVGKSERVMPVLPIMKPASYPDGQFLVKISDKVPVLHMSYRKASAPASTPLVDLGIHVFDPLVLGQLSYSTEIGQLLSKPSAKGVLAALNGCAGCADAETVAKIAAKWTAAEALALRDFLLDEVLSKLDRNEVSAADLNIVRVLPVWARHGYALDDKAGYGPIETDEDKLLCLPPRDVDLKLVGKGYYRIRSVADRRLFGLLDVKSASKGEFYSDFLVPSVEQGTIKGSDADKVVVELLKNLPQLEAECQGLTDRIKTARIVRSNSGDLCAPSELYDPQAGTLKALMPPHLFPDHNVFFESSLLLSLRTVGLRTAISADGVIVAAKAIESEFLETIRSSRSRDHEDRDGDGDDNDLGITNLSAGVSMQTLVRRAVDFLRYLELNIEGLVGEVDQQGLEEWKARQAGAAGDEKRKNGAPNPNHGDSDSDSGSGSDSDSGSGVWSPVGKDLGLGGSWADSLRSIAWMPVYTDRPARYSEGLPWPKNIHSQPLAAPSQCIAQDSTWLCSSTSRVSSYEVKSDMLSHVLAIDRQVPGRNIALQLVNLNENFEALSEGHRAIFARHNAGECVRVLKALAKCLETETEEEVRVWCRVLEHKRVIWVADGFIEASRMSLKRMVGLNTEPFLYTVPSELESCTALLKLLGVRDSFGPIELAGMLRQLANLHSAAPGAKPTPLEQGRVEVVLGILRLIVKLVSPPEEEQKDDGVEGAAATEDDEDEGATMALPTVTIEELGIIYAPDRANVLHSAVSLSYDDAPWISSALVNKNSQIKFVHSLLSVEEARILGARSLREQLFAGAAVVCPDARALKSALGEDSVVEALTDLLSVADSLGATSFDIAMDMRDHPSESLMHPGLAEANGHALLVHIGGPALESEEVVRLITPSTKAHKAASSPAAGAGAGAAGGASLPPPPPSSQVNSNADPVNDDNNGSGSQEFNVPYPMGGKRLLGAFAITDCLQILTGTEFFVFDPCGTHLFNESPDEARNTRKALVARAQRCDLDPSMISRFPDQFLPFLQTPFRVSAQLASGAFEGLLIRMPLRKKESRISDVVVTSEMIKAGALGVADAIEGSLVFSNSISSATCGHFAAEAEAEAEEDEEEEGEGGSQAQQKESGNRGDSSPSKAISQRAVRLVKHFSYSLAGEVDARNARRKLLRDKGWKKSGGLGGYFKHYEPPELSCHVTITRTTYYNGWTLPKATVEGVDSTDPLEAHRPWLIVSTMGAGRVKDEALKDVYREHRLPPFTSAAVLLLSEEEMDSTSAPARGLLYCNGSPVGVSGLPFHAEGPYIQDVDHRLVPLYPLRNRPRGKASIRAQWNDTKPAALKSGRLSVFGAVIGGGTATLRALDNTAIEKWNESLVITAVECLYPRILEGCARAVARMEHKSAGWYKHWLFLSRVTAQVKTAIEQSTLNLALGSCSFYLTAKGFGDVKSAFFPALGCPDAVVEYMKRRLALGVMPPQVSRDLKDMHVSHADLTAPKLREALKRDVPGHCRELREKKDVAMILLNYCTQDLKKLLDHITTRLEGAALAGRDRAVLQKSFAQLCGAPLLPMSDGSVRPFPKSARERLCFAPLTMHALMPALSGIFIHPTALDDFSLFENELFLSSVYLCNFSAAALKDYVNLVLPPSWRRSAAVGWVPAKDDSSRAVARHGDPAAQASGSSHPSTQSTTQGIPSASVMVEQAPSEQLMFVLWREVLQTESEVGLEELSDWPLLPVTSRGRRLLISPRFLPITFFVEASQESVEAREQIARKVDRQAAVHKMQTRVSEGASSWAAAAAGVKGQTESSRWAWIDDSSDPELTSRNAQISATATAAPDIDNSPTRVRADTGTPVAQAASVEDSSAGEVGEDGVLTVGVDGRLVAGGEAVPSRPVEGPDALAAQAVAVEDSQEGTRVQGLSVVHGVEVAGGGDASRAQAEGGGEMNILQDMVRNVQAALAGADGDVEEAARPAAVPAAELSGAPAPPVMAALERLGAPVIDTSIFEAMPTAIKDYLSRQYMTQGKRILDCLCTLSGREQVTIDAIYHTHDGHDEVNPVLTSPGGTLSDVDMESRADKEEGYILNYESPAFTGDDRLAILSEILAGHRESNLSNGDLDRLKTLSLFTSYPSGQPTSIAEYDEAYYCTNDAVLDTLAILTTNSGSASSPSQAPPPPVNAYGKNSSPPSSDTPVLPSSLAAEASAAVGLATPVILINEPRIADLYRALEVRELTEALAVKKFIVPALQRSSPAVCVRIFTKLAARWDAYGTDTELVEQLKKVSFVPVWTSMDSDVGPSVAVEGQKEQAGAEAPNGGTYTSMDEMSPAAQEADYFQRASRGDPVTLIARRADQLCSWKNRDLLKMLRGDQQASYFAPPWMRSDDLHKLMLALGMKEELSKDMFMEIASGIDQYVSIMKREGKEEEGVATAALRARRLLLYVKDDDRCMGLFDTALCKRLSRVAFVPLLLPVTVEPGGHVEFRLDVVRFNQALAASQATLGFSVLPVLEEDISPPHIFHSSLGVNSSPSASIVLKHLHNLTANGKGNSLDRWNISGHTVEATFGAIFTYLNDHWATVAAPIQANLMISSIVPVGHMLIRPGRLFFRLTEDLSPFMHEVPRHFGVHEAFLKRLGIKETPSAADYCDFLEELRAEGRGHPLNANELKAIVTVIQAIASDGGAAAVSTGAGAGAGAGTSRLCVPDEDSVLQPVGQCLINDDPWLRSRAGITVPLIHMHMLHPSIPPRVARQLQISRISQVFIEEVGFSRENPPLAAPDEDNMLATMRRQLSSEAFVRATIALMSSSGAGGTGAGANADAGPAEGGGVIPPLVARGGIEDEAGVHGEQQLGSRLRAMEFRFVQSVPTYLRLDNRFTGEGEGKGQGQSSAVLREETAEESLFFFSRELQQVYINAPLLEAPITPEVVISVCICKLLGMDTSLAAAVAALMQSGVEDGVSAGSSNRPRRVLDAMQIGVDVCTLRERQRGMPGEKLTEIDSGLLELKPFRIFRPGEIVAVAVAAAAGDGPSTTPVPVPVPGPGPPPQDNAVVGNSPAIAAMSPQEMADHLRYGRVLSTSSSESDSTASGVRKAQVQVSTDRTVTLLSTNIYSFRSARDAGSGGGGGSAPGSPVGRGRTPSTSTPAYLRKKQGAIAALPMPPPAPSGGAGKEKEGGPDQGQVSDAATEVVSERDVLGAINGLLARTGIPMSLQEQDLMARVLELQSSQKRAEAALQLERRQHSETRSHLANTVNAFHCQVCLTNDIDHVMTPCGHPICETCLSHLNRQKCPFCRSNISKSIKVYLPEVEDDL